MNIKISGFFLLNLCRFFRVVWEHGIRRKVQHPCLLQFYTTEQDRSDLTTTLLSSPSSFELAGGGRERTQDDEGT